MAPDVLTEPEGGEDDAGLLSKEEREVLGWRRLCLLNMGIDYTSACLLAVSGADLRAVLKALDNGCSVALAVDIFA